jgi:hypothetical protein
VKKTRILAAALFLLSLGAASGEGSVIPWAGGGGPHFGLDLFVGTPSARADVFRSVFPGASLRYIATRNLEFSLDYAFMETEYYYPVSGSGPWVGPVEWSSMPANFSGMKDNWIFFQTKHFLAPQIWYVAPLDELELPAAIRVGIGPAISFLVPNEAARYYPGLSDAFSQFTKTFDAFLGLSLHLGLEYRPMDFVHVGVEYLFLVDKVTEVASGIGSYGVKYFERAGNLMVFAGVRL